MTKTKAPNPKKQLLILMVVAVIGFVLLLIFQRSTLEDTWQTLLEVDLRYVLLLPLLQVLNYYFIGTYYRKMFEVFGAKISVARSWGVVAAMNFVNQVLPSGGLSGITYLAYGFRAKIATGKTALVQIGRYMFAFTGYLLLSPVAIGLIYTDGESENLNKFVDTATSDWTALIVVAIFVLLMGSVVASFFNRKVSQVIGRISLKFVNTVNSKVLRRKKDYRFEPLKKLNHEFHQGTDFIKDKGWRAITPSVNMLLSVLVEVSIVYMSVLAVGGGVGIGPVFLAFVAANVVGVISIIPGDVGVHEATVIVVLEAFGVSRPAAVSATLLYRVFNKFIFLPIGFYFYARILKPALGAKGE